MDQISDEEDLNTDLHKSSTETSSKHGCFKINFTCQFCLLLILYFFIEYKFYMFYVVLNQGVSQFYWAITFGALCLVSMLRLICTNFKATDKENIHIVLKDHPDKERLLRFMTEGRDRCELCNINIRYDFHHCDDCGVCSEG